MDNKVLNELEKVLGCCEKYLDENNQVLKSKVQSDVLNMNDDLLSIILSNETLKNTFFKNINGNYVFDKVAFSWTINSSEFLPNSYTLFKNKVGLIDENSNFISRNSDVSLAFPYKDCVLIGGQTKEEEKREESFINETLCKNDVDTIFEPKVLKYHYKYDGKISRDFTCSMDDNFIIKGNNLFALYSLLPRYAGKVKLIYIDVPFNTGSDSFLYNDKFTRSTWLTFMKNRIEVAKQLLCDDGSFFIHCDYNQAHYLKVLLDEVVGEENFVNEIIWRYRTYVGQVKDFFPRKHDTIFWYINGKRPDFNKTNVGNFEDTPDYERWKNFLTEDGKILFGNHPKTDSRFTAYLNKYIKQYGNPNVGDVIYENRGYIVDDVWDDIIALDAKNKSERLESFSGSGQKPEALIERIIDSVTKENDIVLDFFMGSGTTMAVAHKMKRRYIGIEQMDYIEDISVNRLNSVIAGEKGGISQKVNWQGGGSYIYCELLKQNAVYLDLINKSDDSSIYTLYDEILNNPFIVNYKVDISLMKKADIKENFAKLSLDDKKKILISLVDKNNLYVNYVDRDDKKINVADEDIKFTKSFYGEK